MIINPDKCKYMCMGKNSDGIDTLSSNEFNLKNSDYEIILGITIEQKLTFTKHIKNLCKKAGQKLCALLRISPYLDENKKAVTLLDDQITIQLLSSSLNVLLQKIK